MAIRYWGKWKHDIKMLKSFKFTRTEVEIYSFIGHQSLFSGRPSKPVYVILTIRKFCERLFANKQKWTEMTQGWWFIILSALFFSQNTSAVRQIMKEFVANNNCQSHISFRPILLSVA